MFDSQLGMARVFNFLPSTWHVEGFSPVHNPVVDLDGVNIELGSTLCTVDMWWLYDDSIMKEKLHKVHWMISTPWWPIEKSINCRFLWKSRNFLLLYIKLQPATSHWYTVMSEIKKTLKNRIRLVNTELHIVEYKKCRLEYAYKVEITCYLS